MNSDSSPHKKHSAFHRGNFASRLGIILATAGSSVGLGNIWRFPVETGEHGGAAFILIYLACVIFLGVPMMTAEFIIGRRTHTDIASAYETLVRENPLKPSQNWLSIFKSLWPLTGYAGMLCVTLILSYYAVVAGWENGIERFSKVMMPLLLLLMILLAVGAMRMPGASAGVEFLLKPDFSKIDSTVVLSALGQAFFSLSIAIGCLATYASYFKPDVPLMKTAANVVGIDTLVAFLSGFIIFPAVFSVQGVAPDAGPGLVFVTLPQIFNSLFSGLPFIGYLFSLMFYVLLVLAALTSTISMHEEVTAFFVDRYHTSRRRAATYMTLTTMVLGTLCCLSFGLLADFKPFFGRNFFDAFNDLTAQWIMPLSGIVLSLFVGWRLPKSLVIEELTNRHTLRYPPFLFHAFFFLIRWFAPLAISLIFLNELLG